MCFCMLFHGEKSNSLKIRKYVLCVFVLCLLDIGFGLLARSFFSRIWYFRALLRFAYILS